MHDNEIQRHHGPIALTLICEGEPARAGQWSFAAAPVVLQRTIAMISVLIDGPARDCLATPGLNRARIELPDGQVFTGRLRNILPDYFEVIEDGRP